MATLKELNIKIGSLKQTQKITSAMKLIATTRFNKMQSSTRKSEEYLRSLNALYPHIQKNSEALTEAIQPTTSQPDEKPAVQFLLFTSDRGLCGSFNNAVIKTFAKLLEEQHKQYSCYVDCIGRRGYERFKQSPYIEKIRNIEGFGKNPSYAGLLPYADAYLKEFKAKTQTRLTVVYNEFISTISQKPKARQLLPFIPAQNLTPEQTTTPLTTPLTTPPVSASNTPTNTDRAALALEPDVFLFEPDSQTLAERYIEEMLRFNLYQILLQSITGEHAARMTAMDNATRNCEDLIDANTLERNRVRQAAITTELTEIISGAEAAASA